MLILGVCGEPYAFQSLRPLDDPKPALVFEQAGPIELIVPVQAAEDTHSSS